MSGSEAVKETGKGFKQKRMGDFFSKAGAKSKTSASKESPAKKSSDTKVPLDVKNVKKTSENTKGTDRSSLKRKVTGAGMFGSVWTRGAQKDTEEYRNGYPGKTEHPNLDDNYQFYMNELSSKPDGDFIDNIHASWFGDYDHLEVHHGYIQWLFPLRESGLNWHAQELQLHEIDKLMKKRKAMKRLITSYKMMLNFYGMKLVNEKDGEIAREENWRHRFGHLNRSFHNYLRITRILKCLGEFGFEHLKANFVKFVLHEGMVELTLPNLIQSCVKYWIGVLKDSDEREEVFDLYETYLLEQESKRSKKQAAKKILGKSSEAMGFKKQVRGTSTKVGGSSGSTSAEGKAKSGDYDDELDTLEYAMSMNDSDEGIEDDGDDDGEAEQAKKKRDHELSATDDDDDDDIDGDFKTPDAVDESQEMSYWNDKSSSDDRRVTEMGDVAEGTIDDDGANNGSSAEMEDGTGGTAKGRSTTTQEENTLTNDFKQTEISSAKETGGGTLNELKDATQSEQDAIDHNNQVSGDKTDTLDESIKDIDAKT